MAEAAYFHTTLYAFDADARGALIKCFNAEVQDVSVRIWYDVAQDAFCVVCPSGPNGPRGDGPPIGPLADNVLGDVISKFIAEELADAEREGRAPKVRRFLESDIDAMDVINNDHDMPLLQQSSTPGPAPALDSSPTPGSQPTLIRHFIKVKDGATSKIQMLRMRDLPLGILERVLTPDDRKWATAVGIGLSPRVVRFDEGKECFVFNGRLGQAIQPRASSEPGPLELVKFQPFKNQRQIPVIATQDDGAHTSTHHHLQHRVSNVQHWRAGVQDPEDADPNTMPDMPPETQNFVAQETRGPLAAAGRPRIPRACAVADLMGFSDSSENSDQDDEGSASGLAFADLLSGKSKDTRKRGDVSNEKPSDAEPTYATITSAIRTGLHHHQVTVGEPMKETNILSSPPHTQISTPAAHLTPNVTPPNASNATYKPMLAGNIGSPSTQSTATARSSTLDDSTVHTFENTIPAYKQKYDAIDRIGLNTSAFNQAKHENNNPSPRNSKGSKRGIASRKIMQASQMRSSSPTDVQSTAMSLSTGIEPQAFRSPEHRRELSRSGNSSRHDSPSGSRDWENRAASRIVAQGHLVDISAPTSQIVRKPPGIEFGPDTSPPTSQGDFGIFKTTNKSGVDQDEGVQNTIEERLAPELPAPKKHYTMKQKNGKKTNRSAKNKGNTSNTQRLQVQLEKPEALPTRPTSKSTAKTQNDRAATTPATSRTPATDARTTTFVQDLKQVLQFDDSKIVVCFGLHLLWQQNDASLKDVSDYIKLESKLGSGAAVHNQFNTRLTTSKNDFEYLLSVSSGECTAGCVYDFQIKTNDGECSSILVDPERPNDLAAAGKEYAVAYFMYPMHAFDAQFSIKKVDGDDIVSRGECENLVDSLCLLGEGPAIRGLIETNAFSIEKIYAKRVFRKTKGGITLYVNEVSELKVEALDTTVHDNCNFQASALLQEEMIEEQRLWFEAGLESSDFSNAGLVALEETMDDIVARIDGVGHSNKGPWVRQEVQKRGDDGSNSEWFKYRMW